MLNSKPPRRKTPDDIEAEVLTKSLRRCILCFHLKNDLRKKHGQIAHLNGDRTDYQIDNLAFICLKHHSLFDSTTSQHKNYTLKEVKAARTRLYDAIAKGDYLMPAVATESQPLQAQADKKILIDFLQMLPSNGTLRFLRTNDLSRKRFHWQQLDDIEAFVHDRNGPDHEFLDVELETGRKKFRGNCLALLLALAVHTFDPNNDDRHTVPRDWEYENPERFNQAVTEIRATTDAVCMTYDDLVRLARRKLAF